MQVPCACLWLALLFSCHLSYGVSAPQSCKTLKGPTCIRSYQWDRHSKEHISVQGKLPTDDASISYQNTISIGFHRWNDMQRPSTLCSAVWPETMEVSLPCTSPAAPRVIRAPLLSQGSRTTALAWEVWKDIVKLLVSHSDSLQIYKFTNFQ